MNTDDDGKEENKYKTFFNRKTVKGLKVHDGHCRRNQKNESMYCMRSNRGMEQIHLEVLKRWW
jgi:hypothetical protein